MEGEDMNLFDSHIEGAQRLPQRDKEKFYTALIEYVHFGREPDLSGCPAADAAFTMILPVLETSRKKAEAGRKGGLANGKASSEAEASSEASPEADGKQSDKQNGETEKAKGNSKGNSSSKGNENSVRFAPPTPEQVGEYAAEKGLTLDPHRFCDYYASKGWKVGSSPMKDWKAAARNWSRRDSKGVCDAEAQRYASLV